MESHGWSCIAIFCHCFKKNELIAFWNWSYHLAHVALFAARICAELARKRSSSLDSRVHMDTSQSWTECSCQIWQFTIIHKSECWLKWGVARKGFCSQPAEEKALYTIRLVLLQLRDKWERSRKTHSPNIQLVHIWTLNTLKFFLYTWHTILPTLSLFRRSRSYTGVDKQKQICRSDLQCALWKG